MSPNQVLDVIQSSLEFDTRGRLKLGRQFNNQYLTLRELDILKCIILGYSAKEAGIKLGVSPRTIETYWNAIKLKLRCSKKSEIVGLCFRLGLIKIWGEIESTLA